jgi:hypothetical protein
MEKILYISTVRLRDMIELLDCYEARTERGDIWVVYKNGHMVGKMIAESEERAIKLWKREEARKNRISSLIATHISMENGMFGL